MRTPDPHRPEHRNEKRLHVTWWHVDQQIPDLTTGHSLEMLYYGIDVPAVNVLAAGLNDVPALAREFDKRTTGKLAIDVISSYRKLDLGHPRGLSLSLSL